MATAGRRFRPGHNAKLMTRAAADGDTLSCPRCGERKPLADFPKKGRYRHGAERYGYCRPCHAAYQRVHKLRNIFGITPEEYDEMFEAQGGVCAICGRPPAKTRLSVDHDHKSGQVRGLVCWICNRALGMVTDDPERLRRMIAYLLEPPAVAVIGERFGRKGRTTNKAPKRRKKSA
jgi:hypothetical protein